LHKKNNFDFLRLIFASFVLLTHSYALSGTRGSDGLYHITNGQLAFSDIGVKGFFIISGFLIFQSLERSKSLLDFYWKRFLRLFPALAVVLLLTVLLAPFVYHGSTPYLSNKTVWTYLPNNLSLYRIQYNISGIFDDNIYKSAINGSLWTIPYEFTMYVLLSFLFLFRRNKWITRVLLLVVFSLFVIENIFYSAQLDTFGNILSISLKWLTELGAFFIAGALIASMKIEQSKYFNSVAFIALAALIISLIFHHYGPAKFFTLPLVVICIGLKSTPVLNVIGDKIGDLSYGIYIYGFPVQQTLMHYFKFSCFELLFFSLIISYSFAYLSWHLIEAKALKLKKLQINILQLKKTPPAHF
jgi:peptidoglycan/LPS O-acetylase OafA/YrhL